MPKSKRKPSAAADTRKGRILAAAVELFSRYGYYETEIDAIAKVAGVAKGTVYNHFDGKHALFMATVEFAIERLSERVAGSTRGIDDPAAALEAAIDSYLSFLRDNRHLHRILFLHRSASREAEELRFAERYLAPFSLFEPALSEGVARGAFRPVDVRVASFAITGMILAAHREQATGRAGGKSPDDLSPIRRLVLEGLASARPARDHGPSSRA